MTKQSKTYLTIGLSAAVVLALILLVRSKAKAQTPAQPENLLDRLLALIPGGATRKDIEEAYKKKTTVSASSPEIITKQQFYEPYIQSPNPAVDLSGLTIDDTIYG
ncbi:MAG: hypothetical protein FJZ56_05220 [Chlamydiae bacterium]|nr:hypothetical protein [Chlamydiota bacterium]